MGTSLTMLWWKMGRSRLPKNSTQQSIGLKIEERNDLQKVLSVILFINLAFMAEAGRRALTRKEAAFSTKCGLIKQIVVFPLPKYFQK